MTDDGFFGRGIYTTTDPRLAFAYAKDAIVFACLALYQYKYTTNAPRHPSTYDFSGCPLAELQLL